ncbi:MAG: PQQ-binding-like beta-propeller repeat protein [Planctomycetaceae bacterium]|nr:PQQ-binding-like beta-propeller repeat protein [Planctomycetaceae bacterium]
MNIRNLILPLLLLGLLVSQAQAGTFTGRISEISPDGSQISVTSSTKKKTEVFSTTSKRLKVSINQKPAKANQLKVGDIITVITSSSGDPLKIFGRQKGAATTSVRSNEPTKNNSDEKPGWCQFLGPNRKNLSSETGLLKSWPESGPKLLWTARNLGEGYSAVSVVDGKVFCMGTRAGREIVLTFDLKTGEELWATPNGDIFRNNQGNGPRSTPTYDNGKLYSLGAMGDLSCLDASTGRGIWKQNILTTYGGTNIVWGISESPLVDGDKVICTPGGSIATMVALNKQSGAPVWLAKVPGNPKAGYASAIIAEIHGKKQYINFCHNGLLSVEVGSGNPLWGDDNAANGTANCSSAIVIGNSVFYASGYGTGGALLNFSSRDAKPVMAYKTEKMKNHHGGMVYLDGYIYGANGQIMTCLNVKTGKIAWQDRLDSKGKGAITYAEGMLYFRSEQGPMFLIEANPEEANIISRFEQPERSGKNAWARPVIANGKLFLRDQDILLCYEVSK